MTDSEDDDETLIYELQMRHIDIIKSLRKQIDEMEQVVKYMEKDNEQIWKLVEKIKEKKKDIRIRRD